MKFSCKQILKIKKDDVATLGLGIYQRSLLRCKEKECLNSVCLTMSFLFSRKMDSFLRKETTTSSSSSSSRSKIFTSMWTMFLFLIFSSVRVSSARFSSRHRATTGWNTPEATGSSWETFSCNSLIFPHCCFYFFMSSLIYFCFSCVSWASYLHYQWICQLLYV